MIKAKEGEVFVEGTPTKLLADLATIVRATKETLMKDAKEEFVKERIDYAVKVGLMNEDETKKEAEKKEKEAILALVGELLGGLFDEDK